MPFVLAVSVLLFILCGAVFADALGIGRRGERRGKDGAMRSAVVAILALAPAVYWSVVWLLKPRWGLGWEIASILQGLLVLIVSGLALRAGAGWPPRLRLAVRIIAIFLGALFLGLIIHALVETLPAWLDGSLQR